METSKRTGFYVESASDSLYMRDRRLREVIFMMDQESSIASDNHRAQELSYVDKKESRAVSSSVQSSVAARGVLFRRILVGAVCLAVLVAGFIFVLPGLSSGGGAVAKEPIAYAEVIVKQGDSLWSIADRYASERIRKDEFIEHIKQINELDSDVLYAGESLDIPTNL